jgi:lipoprotein-anchoring transpeptidase ErfK/SrfK
MMHGAGDYRIAKNQRMESHGCIRMRDRDVLELAGFLYEGFPVRIRLEYR